MLAPTPQTRAQSAPLIGGLLILVLAAIALALPPSPIERAPGSEGIGALFAPGLFSDGLAEQNARNGYGYMALDITGASDDREALWREQLEVVSARRYPVWAWIDVAHATGGEWDLLASLHVSGVYLYGEGAAAHVSEAQAARPGLPVRVVCREGKGDPKKDAIALELDSYLDANAGEFACPVLIADQLGAAQEAKAVEHARKLAGEDGTPTLLIARQPLLR